MINESTFIVYFRNQINLNTLETLTSLSRNNQLRFKRKGPDSYISSVNIMPENSPISQLTSDFSESFSDYIAILNIPRDLNIMILPSAKHYYYEAKDLKKVKILVNLKQLNDIKNIWDFLRTVSAVMPLKSYFIGTFFNHRDKNIFLSDPHKPAAAASEPFDLVENGISSRVPFLNLLYRLIDFRIERYMTKTTVSLHLDKVSLKVLNMTDIKGLTYFCAQKTPHAEYSSS
jgi:hypothetical protein